jgi:hypothetical protein
VHAVEERGTLALGLIDEAKELRPFNTVVSRVLEGIFVDVGNGDEVGEVCFVGFDVEWLAEDDHIPCLCSQYRYYFY